MESRTERAAGARRCMRTVPSNCLLLGASVWERIRGRGQGVGGAGHKGEGVGKGGGDEGG